MLQPPIAKVIPKKLEKHGHVRVDDYHWLKERENPEVVAYLKAENAYLEGVLAHTKGFQGELFREIVGRIKQDDRGVPYRWKDWFYYWKYPQGGEYPVWCRKKGTIEAPEEVMVDGNRLAEGHDYFDLGGVEVSSGQDHLAYATDTVGRRKYTIRFRNLETGKDLPDLVPDVTGNHAWANDNRTLFYSKQDPETLRWNRIYRHVLGTDPAQDDLVFEEKDEGFSAFIYKTKSEKFLIIGSAQTLSSEYHYLEADHPEESFKVFLPREPAHEYSIDHLGENFYIRTNWGARNFRLMKRPLAGSDKKEWREVIPHREDVFVADFELFREHLVVTERREGLIQIRIQGWNEEEAHYLDFGEPAYDAYVATNPELDSHVLRYGYTSLTTPNSTIDYDMASRTKTVRKEEEVLGGFDKTRYGSERLSIPARDGTRVPVSLVYRKDLFQRNGRSPLLLYGYGSYGASMDAGFRSYRLSLLDRGFVFAIAHVRGGQELGRPWYEAGKLLKKKNTFTDFIDCARFLAQEKYSDPEGVYAEGGSAGGLLMGAVANLTPKLFRGIVSHVPFVDVVTTMLDADIPLTTGEYDEWGNPHRKDYYDYILSYSPYDNLKAQEYPHILVTTGLHDSQVQYWEPAKYVAKMRVLKKDSNRLLLKTNMEAGHGGASGRFQRHQDTALSYAFLLDLAGITR